MQTSGIHHLFEAQVLRTPGAVAVVAGDRVVSYRELNARANALALALIDQGMVPDTLVGLVADRSPEMVAGILGILKAGAAYVPLNPTYPLERLAYIVGDAGLGLLVATPGQEVLAAKLGAAIVSFPEKNAEGSNPDGEILPEHLAYVIHTSGSTGDPKGVALPHAGLVALLNFTREQMRIGPGDRVLQFASFSFDASLWEIFAAIGSGAALVLGSRDELMPGPALHAFLRRHEVSIALLSPSVLQILPAEHLDHLRVVVAGTEKLTAAIVARWKSPHRRFFNAYGPTETTIYQTIWEAPDGPLPDNPPIGIPTPGVEVYLLGADSRPVQEGESGELCLGGVCLGRGYVNRPELTREKFVSLPLGPKGETIRVYRSGDRARRLPDGSYEYLGRLDLQVKVRGFRVEPGEIEVTLEKHPGVDSSAVISGQDGSGQTRLWAYFIPRGDLRPTTADLKPFLAGQLPDYMIPSGFTRMESWPLNANGKLDRRALPHPLADLGGSQEMRMLSDTEAHLLEFCREILGHPGLALDDSLLEAGFHSLALAQLAWRVQGQFGVAPTFSEMFGRRTVAELASLVESRGGGSTASDPVSPSDRIGPLPLSFAQERVWFLEQLHPGNNAYRFQSVLRFRGRLDIPALEKALNLLVQRHEILRTTFPQSAGRPSQRIHPYQRFTLPVEEAARPRTEQRISEIIREPFDLEHLPLAHWILFRLKADEYWLLHTEHHLLHDGWGYGVFLKELFASYEALAAGRDPLLPALRIQFADFAVWERRQLESGRWDSQLDYWQKRLQAAPSPAQLPPDRPRPSTQTFAGFQIRQPLDRELHARLLAACAREGVTPYIWLHAAFQVFLHRYTGQDDLVSGTAFANRHSAEVQEMLGMVINTAALRMDFSGRPDFREILRRFRQAALEAADHQDAPYDHVVQRLGPGTTRFHAFFDSYDQTFPSLHTPDLRVESEDGISNGTCKFDLVALVIPGDSTPATLLWEYNTDLFSTETARRMMRHYLSLLSATLAEPEAPIFSLPMLDAEETGRLLAQGREEEDLPPFGQRIDQLFDEMAASRGPYEALVCSSGRLNYAALQEHSIELAAALHSAGVQPGEVVAFRLSRGIQAVTAMLAILRCRCAYLPLDPALPEARTNALLESAGVGTLITEAGIVSSGLPARPLPESWQAQAAYVLFTSGSTGQPKPVCVPHHAVVRLSCGVSYVTLDSATRFLQLAPLSFDASTLEIWGPLLQGGTVVIHPDDLPDFPSLGRTLTQNGVTTAWFTAALFNQILDTSPEILRPLREILTGGEALSVPHMRRAVELLPETRLTNGYGPTECTTFATTFEIPRNFPATAASVPLGRPISHTQVYVLNEELQLQPPGVAGEIFLGGAGLAHGYLGDAALTAEKFIPDPFRIETAERLYRTGDLGRWLPDGNMEFLGRRDDQVKIRGFRIEPGEIECMLAQHPAVRTVAVIAREEEPGQRRLVAYVAGNAAAGELRRFLKERVPDYMLPAAFVLLDALPLTPSGKVDRRALPAQAGEREEKTALLPARTPLEEVLAGIWANVLKVDRVGVHDDFFLSGGHSLLALQLIHEINSAFGLELPVRLLFTEPTVDRQAREIERSLAFKIHGQVTTYPPLVPLRPGGSRKPFFLVAGGFGGEAELLVYAGLARHLDSQQPFYGLRARGVDELVEPHDSVENMAAEHIAEIRKIQPRGPYFIGGSCVGSVVAFEIAQQLRAAGEAIALLVLIDSRYPNRFRYGRDQLRILWHYEILPLARRCRQGPSECRAALKEKFQILAAPSPEQKIGLRKMQIGREYMRRMLRYAPRVYPGPITLLVCEELRARDSGGVWRGLAGGGLDIQFVPGDHLSHLREHARVTAARLEACLEAAQTPTANGREAGPG